MEREANITENLKVECGSRSDESKSVNVIEVEGCGPREGELYCSSLRKAKVVCVDITICDVPSKATDFGSYDFAMPLFFLLLLSRIFHD